MIAVAGRQAYLYSSRNEQLLKTLARELKVPFEAIPERLSKMQDSLRQQERELKQAKQKLALQQVAVLASKFESPYGYPVLIASIEVAEADDLKHIAENLKGQKPQAVVVLGASIDGKVNLVAAVSSELSKSVKAGDLIKGLAPLVGARGGGKPEFAQAGGGDQPAGLSQLRESALKLLPQTAGV